MIIKALTLENFKGIAEPVRIEFKPITLLFGPNSAGKSTVLQALVYAREVLERHNLDPDRTLLGGEWMDLGGFDSLVHGHDRSRRMVIGFELDVHDTDLPDYLHEGDSWLLESAEGGGHFPEDWLSRIETIAFSLVIRWSQLLERPLVERVRIDANGRRIAELACSQDARDTAIEWLDLSHPIFRDEAVAGEEPTSWFTDLLADALHEQRTRDWPETTNVHILSESFAAQPGINTYPVLPHMGLLMNLSSRVTRWLSLYREYPCLSVNREDSEKLRINEVLRFHS